VTYFANSDSFFGSWIFQLKRRDTRKCLNGLGRLFVVGFMWFRVMLEFRVLESYTNLLLCLFVDHYLLQK